MPSAKWGPFCLGLNELNTLCSGGVGRLAAYGFLWYYQLLCFAQTIDSIVYELGSSLVCHSVKKVIIVMQDYFWPFVNGDA